MRAIRLGKILSRLLRREIFRDWSQSLAIVMIGAIASTLYIGLTANGESMQQRVDEMVSLSSPANIYVTTDPHALSSQDDSDFILAHLDSQDYLESRFYGYCSINSKNVMLAISPRLPHLSTAYDLTLAPTSTESDYLFIDESFGFDQLTTYSKEEIIGKEVQFSFDLTGLSLDDSTINMLGSFLRENQENPFKKGSLSFSSTITGVMKHPENTAKASPMPLLTMMSNKRFHDAIVASLENTFTPTGASLIYRYGFYQRLGWGDGDLHGGYRNFPLPNQYLIHLKDPNTAKAKESAISNAYKQRANNNLYLIQTLDETTFMSTLYDEINQAQKLTFVFPIVFFVVALLVILTTLRQNILKRRSEIGTFKALGLTKGEIHLHFLSQTGILVLLASAIGSIIGPFIIPEIMAKKYNILYTLPAKQYLFPFASALTAISIFILVSLLVTFLITKREISLKPVESMRPKTVKMHRQLGHQKIGKGSSFALSAKMAGRNLLYDPVKSMMVIIGVLGCTALLVCGFGIDDTLDYDIKHDPYVNSFHQCMTTFLSPQTPEKIHSDFASIQEEDGSHLISSYQPYERLSLEIVSNDSTYTSFLFLLGKSMTFDGASAVTHMDENFPKDEIALSLKVAEKLKVGVGNTVKFYIQDTYVEAKIHTIYDAFYGNGIIMHADSSLLSTVYPEFHFAWVDGVDTTKLESKLSELDSVTMVDTYSEWLARIYNIVSSISTMTAAVKTFAVLLAIVVLYNLALLNFRERTRGIATLKVLGFHTVEIAIGLFIEALSMTTLGIIAGLFVGFPFMKLVLLINQVEVIHYIFYIYPRTYFFAALFSLLIAFGVNALMSYRIKNVKSVESLKSVE